MPSRLGRDLEVRRCSARGDEPACSTSGFTAENSIPSALSALTVRSGNTTAGLPAPSLLRAKFELRVVAGASDDAAWAAAAAAPTGDARLKRRVSSGDEPKPVPPPPPLSSFRGECESRARCIGEVYSNLVEEVGESSCPGCLSTSERRCAPRGGEGIDKPKRSDCKACSAEMRLLPAPSPMSRGSAAPGGAA